MLPWHGGCLFRPKEGSQPPKATTGKGKQGKVRERERERDQTKGKYYK